MKRKPPDWLVWLLENSSVTADATNLKGVRLAFVMLMAPFAFIRTVLFCALVSPALIAERLSSKK